MKSFADGVIEGHTGYLLQDYDAAPGRGDEGGEGGRPGGPPTFAVFRV